MNRKLELKKYFKDKIGDLTLVEPFIDEMIKLEEDIAELEKLPKFIVHPKNKNFVKEPPHFKMLQALKQSRRENVRVLLSFIRGTEEKEESPLRVYLKELNK